jgi:hypothetical protein
MAALMHVAFEGVFATTDLVKSFHRYSLGVKPLF